MTLAEKIAALRGARKMSQGDLAEKLDVSRQSVSKWETGQAVPELDKIIKLSDLFGVSVDELVREEEAPKPESPISEPTEKIIYIERPRRLTLIQTLGVILLVIGLLTMILGVAMNGTYIAMFGAAMVILGLPFTLARKHPFYTAGWVVLAVSCLILNPYTSIAPWGLLGGLSHLHAYLTIPTAHYSTMLLGAAVGLIRGLLFWGLLIYTGRLCWKKWNRKADSETETAP